MLESGVRALKLVLCVLKLVELYVMRTVVSYVFRINGAGRGDYRTQCTLS